MSDKSVPKNPTPKGRAYCEKPGTACFYGPDDICVNCLRRKGWRRDLREWAHSVSQSFKLTCDSVMVCTSCKKRLKEYKAGELGFVTVVGPCDCSWACCSASAPKDHAPHLVYLPDDVE